MDSDLGRVLVLLAALAALLYLTYRVAQQYPAGAGGNSKPVSAQLHDD